MTGFSSLAVAEDGGYQGDVQWAGVSRILGPKWAQLPMLTIGLCGVQILWSVEFSYAPPYLISLGLTKSHMAIVFLAGPLSGLIVQPLIGVIADNSKSKFGRRRPYIVMGLVVCVFGMLLLGYTRGFASIFTGSGTTGNDILTVILAVFAIYCIDFSINAIQAVDRALIVDSVPAIQQANVNAWAARMLGIGSVVGFFVGEVDLTSSVFEGSQLEILSVIASLLLVSFHVMTIFSVKERILVSSAQSRKNFRQEVKDIWDNLLTLPRAIHQICIIQLFSWIAWFPILFYTTTYIGELYKRASPVPIDDDAEQALNDEATRLGSRAMFYQALVALAGNFILPYLITRQTEDELQNNGRIQTFFDRFRIHLCEMWALSHLVCALCMFATFFTSSVAGATFLITVTGFSWAITQWAPFSLLAEEILSESPASEVDDTASIRLIDSRSHRRSVEPHSAALTPWVDAEDRSQLISSHVEFDIGDDADTDQEEGNRKGLDKIHSTRQSLQENGLHSRTSSVESDRREGFLQNVRARQSHTQLHLTVDQDHPGDANGPTDHANDESDVLLEPVVGQERRSSGLQAKAGIILGIHNLFVIVPQLLMTALASIIFALFDPAKSVLHGKHPGHIDPTGSNTTLTADSTLDLASNITRSLLNVRDAVESSGPNSVAIVFRVGGFSTAVAFVLSWKLARELKRR